MEKIYKSCSAKYLDSEIERLSGTTAFVTFERMLTTPIKSAVNLKENETIVGMVIEYDGVKCIIEKN